MPGRPTVRISLGSRGLDGPVVIAVAAARVVQVTLDQIVGVVAMGHRLVAAVRAVLVPGRVAAAVVGRRAGAGVGARDLEPMLLDAGRTHVVQVAVVQVVHVAVVLDGRVATIWAVDMVVAGVFGSPFYAFAGELFWGQDRLDMLEEAIVRSATGESRPGPG